MNAMSAIVQGCTGAPPLVSVPKPAKPKQERPNLQAELMQHCLSNPASAHTLGLRNAFPDAKPFVIRNALRSLRAQGIKTPKPPPVLVSPWGLTPGEARVMDAVCEHGSFKAAAAALGLSPKTLDNQTSTAGQKIGGAPLKRYLMWDRWRRGDV